MIELSGDRPVYLRDVANVIDGPAEVDSYSWIGFGPAAENARDPRDRPAAGAASEPAGGLFPAVHIAVAKRKGSNAVRVAEAVEQRMDELAPTHLPDGVYYRITRDYGETANHKVNELVESLVIAVLTVIGLIGVMIGWRAALVVTLAIPVCYSITLFVNLLLGYTINRVTLFALILSLGLLVDDPITDVENIARYFSMRILPRRQAVLRAVQEVRPALILSALAIVASFLPLMFITGMMGPYMAPMALCVPLTIAVSAVVAFVITPWLAMVTMYRKDRPGGEEEPAYDLTKRAAYRLSRAVLGTDPRAALGGVGDVGRRGAPVRRRDGHSGLSRRAAEDAPLRQQERIPDPRRHARGLDPRTDRSGHRRAGAIRGRRGGSPGLPALRRAWPRRWISTAWSGTTFSARVRTSARFG